VSTKTKIFNKISVNEISLVDIPANQEAEMVLFKRFDIVSKNNPVTKDEDILKMELNEKIEALEKAANEKAEALEKAQAQVEALEKANKEALEKASSVETLEKKLVELEKANKIAAIEKRVATELPNVIAKSDKLVELVYEVEKAVSDESKAAFTELLKSANEAFATLVKPVGIAKAVTDDSKGQIEDIAKSLRDADASLTVEQSIAKAALSNPELFAQVVGEKQ